MNFLTNRPNQTEGQDDKLQYHMRTTLPGSGVMTYKQVIYNKSMTHECAQPSLSRTHVLRYICTAQQSAEMASQRTLVSSRKIIHLGLTQDQSLMRSC